MRRHGTGPDLNRGAFALALLVGGPLLQAVRLVDLRPAAGGAVAVAGRAVRQPPRWQSRVCRIAQIASGDLIQDGQGSAGTSLPRWIVLSELEVSTS
jgi:hypothetical protein